jgi:hypothetical protein
MQKPAILDAYPVTPFEKLDPAPLNLLVEDLCEIDLSPFRLFACPEQLNGATCDWLIAEREEFHTRRDESRSFKRISMGYLPCAGPNEGRLSLCEQDTEGPSFLN